MYLLDTMVLSELRKRRQNPNLLAWINPVASSDLFLSVATISEIEIGIERQRKPNPVFAAELAQWLDLTLLHYGERVLPITIEIAVRWGRLAAQVGNTEFDLAIAATALEHGLTVVTRNISDFERTGVPAVDPFR